MASASLSDWTMQQLLAVDWLWSLIAPDGFRPSGQGQTQSQSHSTCSAAADDGRRLIAHRLSDGLAIVVDAAQAPDFVSLSERVAEANRRAAAGDASTHTWWWHVDLSSAHALATPAQIIRAIGQQRPVVGTFNLGGATITSFEVEELDSPFHTYKIGATFPILSPVRGPFAESAAEHRGQLIRAVCSWLTGAALQSTNAWEADAQEATDAEAALREGRAPRLANLPRDVLLYVPPESASDPNWELLRRFQGALHAYDEAINQASANVALILLVSVVEALARPNTNWDQSRVTVRFKRFAADLLGPELRTIATHPNFHQAFPGVSPLALLDYLYDLRSEPVHTGHLARPVGMQSAFATQSTMRIAFAADLARAALDAFSRAPRSSLVGHPEIQPPADQDPTPKLASLPYEVPKIAFT
jgi:hypothetical protein